ncbi:hypothetical protein SAFG77S_11620 [Streptomyces afghaniensis]
MQKYNEYKDSGILWVGKVPSHWKVKRVKHNFSLKNEKSYETNPTILSLTQKGIKVRDISNNHGQIATTYEGYNKVNKGDIVLNPMDLLTGFVDSSPYDGVISPAYSILKPNTQVNNDYYNRLIQVLYFNEYLFGLGEGVSQEFRWTLKNEKLLNLEILEPPIEEQSLISSFIDKKTSEIDLLISDKEKQIDLLKEFQQSIINELVTKGFHSDEKMKERGIKSVGQELWKSIQMRYASEFIQTGPFGSQLHSYEYIQNGIPVINPVNIRNGEIAENLESTISEKKANELNRHRMKKGDIIFGRRGEIGRAALISECEEGWICGTGCLLIRPKKGLFESEFLKFVLSSSYVKQQLLMNSVGSTMDNLNCSILASLRILLPPLTVQKEIAEYLNNVSNQVFMLIESIKSEIQKLIEYRQSLIYEAVTGKNDVREYKKVMS